MVREILSRLPPNFDVEKAQHKYPVLYEESMNQVLCQEMLRYNRLTSVIRNSLKNLDKALQGFQVRIETQGRHGQCMVMCEWTASSWLGLCTCRWHAPCTSPSPRRPRSHIRALDPTL